MVYGKNVPCGGMMGSLKRGLGAKLLVKLLIEKLST
jgi:hypothetical protein